MNHSKTIIVSPSGNFYGSEQVLFDFLTGTRIKYTVFVPAKGRLIQKLVSQNKHYILPFQSVKRLYGKIFFLLLAGKANAVYCNEGGHIKYLRMLAGIFKKAKFINHIRIAEDTDTSRIGTLPPNITIVSISSFITKMLDKVNQQFIKTIYDPYFPQSTNKQIKVPKENNFRIGIIGRVTNTKGLGEMISFCDFLEQKGIDVIGIHLAGDVEEDNAVVSMFVERSKNFNHVKVLFRGFIEDKKELYSSIDIVVHFSKVEPLGRIFFEALDFGVPFIGFNRGGIGEIARILELQNCMINDEMNWQQNLYQKILHIQDAIPKYEIAKANYLHRFSGSRYCKSLEDVIS